MDEEEKAINARAEENSLSETPTDETNAPEVQEESVQAEKTEKSTDTESTEGEKKFTGAEKRIHKLVDERNQYKQEAETLQSKLAELTAQSQSTGDYPTQDLVPDESGSRELTIDDLRTIARLEVEKERTVNRINREAEKVLHENPVLNPESEAFDPDVNEAVTSAVFLEIQKDPSKSVVELTKKYMKPYLKVAESAIAREKETLTKQVNDSALRPSTVKGNEKKFQDKTIEEMEQELEIVH